MPLPELAGILISLGLGAPVQSKERTEAPGGGPSSPGRMSGFQRPHLSGRLSAQVNTEGPLHPENFLDVCRTGSVRQNWSHGDLGLRRAWETMSGVPLAQVPSRPRGRPPPSPCPVDGTRPSSRGLCPEAQSSLANLFVLFSVEPKHLVQEVSF